MKPAPSLIAVLAALMALTAALPAAAQNPLLDPPGTSTGRRPAAPSVLEQERARSYRNQVGPDLRERERLDALGRLDPIERRETDELRRSLYRQDQAVRPPPPLAPTDRQLDSTLRPEPLPGTGYPPPRLGRGGATLERSLSRTPPRKPSPPPER
ncbi:hypothetical protein [Rhodospirillum centenum]|uniref:Uncharacterized protein n=1 Tax=Rhodospirillum centenum (strain ATCC 51521 / SW) TaxID=414684 RepID=B6INL4_RHOCS|nr:hypothetical protein [Rhodospirillum centenum]ACI99111.1 hypothetical protein RC1_1713 [Rhodospirillum centenum SW]